jgi:AP-3 complex subunit mu
MFRFPRPGAGTLHGHRRRHRARQHWASLPATRLNLHPHHPRRPVIQSGFRSAPAAYPAIHIDALNDAVARGGVDPVLYVPTPGSEGTTSSACCHIEVGGMRVLAPVSGDCACLLSLRACIDLTRPLQWIHSTRLRSCKHSSTFSRSTSARCRPPSCEITLTSCTRSVSPCELFHIRRQTFLQLLEETLDAIGHPLTTSPNALRDIVLPPTLLSKVLSAAGASALASTPTPAPFASAIPWRRANVRHTQNEVFFDVAEHLAAVVSKAGASLRSSVRGRLDAHSRLSGTPDLTLSLIGAQNMADAAFHPCVRLARWTRDRSLSFVPPDGRFVLAEYRFAPSSPVPVPLALVPRINLHEGGGTIELTLSARSGGRPLANVCVEVFLGQSASGASCSTSGAPDAGWAFDSARRLLRWDMPTLGTGTAVLKGTFTTT